MAAPLMGVPKWRWPLPEEPAHGLLLHLVELNGYSSAEIVADCLGIRASGLKAGEMKSLSAFARMIRCPLKSLTADSPFELPPEERAERSFENSKARNRTALSIRGVAIGSDQLSRTARRVCPVCIEESRHHRFWWDFNAITNCPRHNCRLVDRCGCGSDTRLNWRDNNLFHCGNCSRNTPLLREPAAPDELAADAYLLKRFSVTSTKDCPALDGMSFFDAVDTMERVGAASLGGLNEKWQSADSLDLDPALVRGRGFSIFSTGGLSALFDDLLEEFRKVKPEVEPAFTTAYGWLYHWFNCKGGRQFSDALAEAFMAHGRDNFHVNALVALDSRNPSLPATYTLEKAAKECAISRAAMRKLGVQLDLIRPTGREGHVLAFDGPTVRAFAQDLRNSVDLGGARAVLGVDFVVFRGLIAAELIAPLFNGSEWRHRYAFRRYDLDALIKDVLGDSSTVTDLPSGTMSALDARRSFNLSGVLFLKLVLQGHVKVVAHLADAAGVSGALVEREDLKTALIGLAAREDAPIPVAAVALGTTNPVVRKLIAGKFLRTSEVEGRQAVTAKSFAEFQRSFISLQEVTTMLGAERERIPARIAKVGLRYKPALERCGFRAYSRAEIAAKLPELKELIDRDLRFNSLDAKLQAVGRSRAA